MSYVFVNARRDWVPCLFGVTSARGPLCSVKVVDRMRQDSLYHFICKTQCNVCISVITIATILTTMAVMLIFRVIQNDSDKIRVFMTLIPTVKVIAMIVAVIMMLSGIRSTSYSYYYGSCHSCVSSCFLCLTVHIAITYCCLLHWYKLW